MTDVAAPNERDPEIHEAFLSLACDPLLQKAPVILKDLLRRSCPERRPLLPIYEPGLAA